MLDGDALHLLNVFLHKRGERLFAQVHSHPGRAYHSPMDDRFAVVTAAGGLSLVVPDFAVRRFSVADCAVYRLTRAGRWAEVPRRRAEALVSVVEETHS
jgi:proteasome lid subunit RPN8/RPN11